MCYQSCKLKFETPSRCTLTCLQKCAKTHPGKVWSCLVANCDWKCKCHPPKNYLRIRQQQIKDGSLIILPEGGEIYRPHQVNDKPLRSYRLGHYKHYKVRKNRHKTKLFKVFQPYQFKFSSTPFITNTDWLTNLRVNEHAQDNKIDSNIT